MLRLRSSLVSTVAAVTTGFSHGAVFLGIADKIIDAVKQGAIKHFSLVVGGCDGVALVVTTTPSLLSRPLQTLLPSPLLAVFRFNDLDLGTIGGIPRILTLVSNDAYGAVRLQLLFAMHSTAVLTTYH